MKQIYKFNKVIWKDTNRVCDQYPHEKAQKIENINISPSLDKDEENKIIKVFNEDIIKATEYIVNLGFKPLVMIPANDNYPMENVKSGLCSIEYDLYRCSNVSSAIYDTMYPLKNLEMIYCPKITMFKNNSNKLLKKTYNMSLALMTPVRRPTLISVKLDSEIVETYSNISEENKMKNKIENLFKLATLNNFDCLILTDFGCGTESNPINKIVEFYNIYILKYSIKYIFFCINSDNFKYFHKFIQR